MTLRRSNIPKEQQYHTFNRKSYIDNLLETHKKKYIDSKENIKENETVTIKKDKGDNTNMEEKTKATATVNYSEIYDYKTITLEQMQDFIEKYYPEDKEDFKKHAIEFVKVKDSSYLQPVYRHMKARKYFCEKYMPELLPKKKAKKSESLLNW